MKFKKDGSLKYVAIAESALHELFRSTKPFVPSDKNISSGECEAYICSSKDNGKFKVFVAFWDISGKASRVYLPDPQPLGTADYQKCIDKSLEFVKELGFAMEGVNLDYGTAMRQVIWGTVKVFRPPKAAAKAPVSSDSDKGRKNTDDNEPLTAKEKPAPAGSRDEAAEEQPDREEKSRDAGKQQVARTDSTESTEMTSLKMKISELSVLNNELVAKSSALETEIEKLRNQLTESRSALAKEQAANADLRHRHEEESALIAKEIMRMQDLISELESSEEKNQENYESAMQQVEQKLAGERKLREDAENSHRSVLKEMEDAGKAAAIALNTAIQERDELKQRLASVEEEHTSARNDLEAKFSAAKSDQETARAETERFRKELHVSREMYDIELAALRNQLRQFLENKDSETRERPIPAPPTPENRERGEAAEAADQPKPAPESPQKTDDAPPRSPMTIDLGTASEGIAGDSVFLQTEEADITETSFSPDRSLSAIPCATPDSLVAVYESSNKIQTVPDGFKIQKSGGYICAVKRNKVPEIYLVWQMLESRQALIFKPKKQPGDNSSFQRILQEALFYFESVGFMMSEVELKSPQDKSGTLKKIQMAA